ncbi:MAG: hypothetical protein EA357_06355 [Micavibrio sp.]|nr:MAG: hypothetical protein EA357_06355 [Micavibrio sp.]
MTQNMKTNPKYVARYLATPLSALVGLAVAIPSGMFLSDKLGEEIVLPDRIGSAMEESIMAEHQANFTQLKQMQAEIALLKSQTVLTEGSSKLTQMKSDFNRLAVNTYSNLYLAGSTQENGAGISETNFQELRQQFSEKIINAATIGFAENINAGMLDEILAVTDLKTGSDVERFQTVKEISKALSESHASTTEKTDKASVVGFVSGTFLFFTFLFASFSMHDKYRHEPRRIPANRPKNPYGKH